MYMGFQTRATAAPIVLVWCSEDKTYSPEAPSYKTTISFHKSTVQHTVLCCAASFMTEAWSRVLLENLKVPRLVKKSPAFYAAHRFATVCTTARHLSTPSHHHNLISFHVHLGLPSGLIPSGLSTKTLYTFVSTHLPYLIWSPEYYIISRGVQTLKLLTVQFSPMFCNVRPLRPKHLPQHPAIDKLQPVLFPWCKRQVSYTYKTSGKIAVVSAAIFRSVYGTHY
jgi:hypothetical protein